MKEMFENRMQGKNYLDLEVSVTFYAYKKDYLLTVLLRRLS